MIRTGYSFRVAYGHISEVLSRLQEIGWTSAPIVDYCSAFGWVRWTKACKPLGLRPVYGVELSVVTKLGEKKPVADRWTFIAKDSITPINELIGLATSTSGSEPAITYAQALAAQGRLFVIAGERVQLEELDAALEATGERKPLFALKPSTPRGLYRKANAAGYEFVAMSDNVYPRESDKEIYRIGLGRRANTQTYPQWILSDDEWRTAMGNLVDSETMEEAIERRNFVLAGSVAELPHAEMLHPERPKPLLDMCLEGAAKLDCDLSDPIYAARLERELKLIKEKNFEDYFYIIADMVNWAKERMVVGPARGSSCGSLVCYLLGITSIDPIPYGLIFERFIDINRTDLPDIDIDFSDTKRYLVFEYAEDRYGIDRVARLGTVGMFKPRSAIKQAAIGLKIPQWKVDKVVDNIIERSSGDSRALQALEDTLRDTDAGRDLLNENPEIIIAGHLEGHPNNASQHAAGIVITQRPIMEYVAVDKRTKSIMCDKKDAESLDLLKIDALGLTQLSIFERTMELIGEKPISGWLEKIPLDDPAAFQILNDHRFAGVFQFTGVALQAFTRLVTVSHISDMISITALARPGPMATGGAMAWARRKNGNEAVTSIHPMLAELTKETYGIVIYQETVMMIVRTIGKLSWEDTSELRKAMSRSMGKEFFDQYWERFKKGALENGIEEGMAKLIWEQVNSFGSWAFNASHAVAYGTVSYWCCWLKAHHPVEFAAATLDAESDPMKQIELLRELYNEGVEYVPVDPEHSVDRWTVAEVAGKKKLIGPLTQIKGIGPTTVKKILEARRDGTKIGDAILKRLERATTAIDSLYPIRTAIAKNHPDLTAINIVTEPTPILNVQPGEVSEVVVVGVLKKIAPRDVNDAQNVQKRGYELQGPRRILNMFLRDDTDEVFCRIDRFNFERLAPAILEKGKAGKALYAFKGTVPKNFRMITVKSVKFLGEIE